MFLMVTWSCGDRGEEWWALSLMSLSMLLSGIALERALLCLSKEGDLGLGWELGQVSAGDLVTLCGSIFPDSLPPEGAHMS